MKAIYLLDASLGDRIYYVFMCMPNVNLVHFVHLFCRIVTFVGHPRENTMCSTSAINVCRLNTFFGGSSIEALLPK